MGVFEIVVEPRVRRRRVRQPLSGKKRAAALFRVWHGLRDMIEEKVASVTSGIATGFADIDASLPN